MFILVTNVYYQVLSYFCTRRINGEVVYNIFFRCSCNVVSITFLPFLRAIKFSFNYYQVFVNNLPCWVTDSLGLHAGAAFSRPKNPSLTLAATHPSHPPRSITKPSNPSDFHREINRKYSIRGQIVSRKIFTYFWRQDGGTGGCRHAGPRGKRVCHPQYTQVCIGGKNINHVQNTWFGVGFIGRICLLFQ